MDADRLVDDAARRDLHAFREMIAASEGTEGPDAYFVLFGHTSKNPRLFVLGEDGDHPRLRFYETHDEFIRNGKPDFTTAAGKYQITASTWDRFQAWRAKQGLAPARFDEAGQDDCCTWLIDSTGALPDVFTGRIPKAIAKCSAVWASLPGGDSGQPQRALDFLLMKYQAAGGSVA